MGEAPLVVLGDLLVGEPDLQVGARQRVHAGTVRPVEIDFNEPCARIRVVVELETERLRLRAWRPEDREPFAALNADPVVMEHFVAPADAGQMSDAYVDRIEAAFAEHGWGLWAAERNDTGAFIGFIGLGIPRFEAPFLPGVEVGWRLAHEHWGHGFAPEGGPRGPAVRVRGPRAGRGAVVHHRRQHQQPPRDGEDRPRPRPRGGLRPSQRARAASRIRPHVLYRITADRYRSRLI